MSELRPYPEYKDFGVPWLGRIPAHWSVLAAKRIFGESSERARPDDEQLSATQSHGVILQAEYEKQVGRKVVRIVNHLDKRRHVEKDDFVISMRSFQGGLERAWCQGAIRSSYVVLKPVKDVYVPFFAHLFKSHSYIQALRTTSEFIRDGQDLTFSNFCDVPLPVVPLDEQKGIADYLDDNAVKVRRFIHNRRRLIEVFAEQKKAIVARAVMKGLNHSVPLQPSGIGWLGDVPKHWEVRKLRFLVDVLGGMTPSKAEQSFWNGDVPWVSPKDMKSVEITESIDHITQAALAQTNITLIPDPAVLIVVRGMILARTFPVAVTTRPVTINQDMKALRPRKAPVSVNALYLRHLLSGLGDVVRELVEESGHGTRVLRTDLWRNLPLPVPPHEEQLSICDWITVQTEMFDRAMRQARREIDLIREYRARLVADVVTGKLDVRAAATAMADEPEATDHLVREDGSVDALPEDEADEELESVLEATDAND